MVNNELRWRAEERHFSALSQAFIDRKTLIFGIPPHEPEIGFTFVNNSQIAEIHIARLHEIMSNLSENERSFFRLGVFAHEVLHQIFTNFIETKRIADSYKNSAMRSLFLDVSNICEDARIEFYAPQVIGGESLTALRFTIKHVYNNSRELGKERFPVEQVLNALIQVGDLGVVRGKFTMPEAQGCFKEVLPLFYKAIREPVCKDCLALCKKIVEIICKYSTGMTEEEQEALEELMKNRPSDNMNGNSQGRDGEASDNNESDKSKAIKDLLDALGLNSADSDNEHNEEDDENNGSGEDTSGTKAGSSNSFDSDSSKDDEYEVENKRKRPTTYEDFDDESDNNGSSNKSENSGKSSNEFNSSSSAEEKSEKESNKSSANEDSELLNAINEILKQLAKKAKMAQEEDFSDAISKNAEAINSKIDDIKREEQNNQPDSIFDPSLVNLPQDPYVKTLFNIKMKPDSSGKYEEYLAQVAPLINSTKRPIEKILKNESDVKERKTSGDLNLMRYHDETYTSARVFDRRRDPNENNACIMILVDGSGSMGTRKNHHARNATILISEVCAKLNIPCYIMGFSADEGVESVVLRHYTTWKNKKSDRTSLVGMAGRGCNRDGASIRYATSMIKKRKEENKILFVLSDGQPFATGYSGKDAILDTKNAIRESRKHCKTIGIAIETPDAKVIHEMYGDDFVQINNASELPSALSKLFKKMF